MYEIFFKYDDSWTYTEILHLIQIIQRILGIKESLVFIRNKNAEIVFDPKISSEKGAQKLIEKIYETVVMAESYKIEYRKCT